MFQYSYTDEDKKKIAQMAEYEPTLDVCKKYGVGNSTLRNWRIKYGFMHPLCKSRHYSSTVCICVEAGIRKMPSRAQHTVIQSTPKQPPQPARELSLEEKRLMHLQNDAPKSAARFNIKKQQQEPTPPPMTQVPQEEPESLPAVRIISPEGNQIMQEIVMLYEDTITLKKTLFIKIDEIGDKIKELKKRISAT